MYVLGIDFGHGETSAAVVNLDVNFRETITSNNLDIRGTKKSIHSAIYKASANSEWYLDPDPTSLAYSTDFRMYFKGIISELDANNKEYYTRFIDLMYHQLLEQVRRNNSYEMVLDNGSPNFKLYIACPSGWSEQDRQDYKVFFENILGIPIVSVISESEAALTYSRHSDLALANRLVNKRKILIIDFGSSTIDFTLMNDDKLLKNATVELGAKHVEEIIFKYMIEHENKAKRAYNELKASGISQLSAEQELIFIVRKEKEAYYGNNMRFMKPSLDLGEIIDGATERFTCDQATGYNSDKLNNEILRDYILQIKNCFSSFKKNNDCADLDAVILTGGASNMDFVTKLANDIFGLQSMKAPDPSLNISQGIAVYGYLNEKGRLSKTPTELPGKEKNSSQKDKQPSNKRGKNEKFVKPSEEQDCYIEIMEVEDVFHISGQGVVTTGKVQNHVTIGDKLLILDSDLNFKRDTEVIGIEMSQSLMDSAEEGDNVGLLLKGIGKHDVVAGDTLYQFMNIAIPATSTSNYYSFPLCEFKTSFDTILGNKNIALTTLYKAFDNECKILYANCINDYCKGIVRYFDGYKMSFNAMMQDLKRQGKKPGEYVNYIYNDYAEMPNDSDYVYFKDSNWLPYVIKPEAFGDKWNEIKDGYEKYLPDTEYNNGPFPSRSLYALAVHFYTTFIHVFNSFDGNHSINVDVSPVKSVFVRELKKYVPATEDYIVHNFNLDCFNFHLKFSKREILMKFIRYIIGRIYTTFCIYSSWPSHRSFYHERTLSELEKLKPLFLQIFDEEGLKSIKQDLFSSITVPNEELNQFVKICGEQTLKLLKINNLFNID